MTWTFFEFIELLRENAKMLNLSKLKNDANFRLTIDLTFLTPQIPFFSGATFHDKEQKNKVAFVGAAHKLHIKRCSAR